MSIFLDRIDSVPLEDDNFSQDYTSWVSVFVDTYNETIEDVQELFNNLQAQPLTQAELTDPDFITSAENGMMWYCTDSSPPNIVLKINNALVQLVTAPFP